MVSLSLEQGRNCLAKNLLKDPLDWLRRNGHSTVVDPFEKGTSVIFLKQGHSPEVLSDVITDAYEALEALAKIVH